jgi:hypothetical protein
MTPGVGLIVPFQLKELTTSPNRTSLEQRDYRLCLCGSHDVQRITLVFLRAFLVLLCHIASSKNPLE